MWLIRCAPVQSYGHGTQPDKLVRPCFAPGGNGVGMLIQSYEHGTRYTVAFVKQEKPAVYANLTSVSVLQQFIAQLADRVRRRRESGRLLHRGNILYQRGELAAAADTYREAIQCDPERAVVRFNLGLVLYKLGEKTAARAEWQTALDLSEAKSPYLAE